MLKSTGYFVPRILHVKLGPGRAPDLHSRLYTPSPRAFPISKSYQVTYIDECCV